MQYRPGQNTLYALCERVDSVAITDRAYLQKWDTVSGQALAGASECMEDWELICFCVTDQDSGGTEVVAGAVSGKLQVVQSAIQILFGQLGGLAAKCY